MNINICNNYVIEIFWKYLFSLYRNNSFSNKLASSIVDFYLLKLGNPIVNTINNKLNLNYSLFSLKEIMHSFDIFKQLYNIYNSNIMHIKCIDSNTNTKFVNYI